MVKPRINFRNISPNKGVSKTGSCSAPRGLWGDVSLQVRSVRANHNVTLYSKKLKRIYTIVEGKSTRYWLPESKCCCAKTTPNRIPLEISRISCRNLRESIAGLSLLCLKVMNQIQIVRIELLPYPSYSLDFTLFYYYLFRLVTCFLESWHCNN